MNNFQMLPKRCHEDFLILKNPVYMRVFSVFDIIPTRSIHFNTKHIGLVFSSFDAIITAIMPIIFGFK